MEFLTCGKCGKSITEGEKFCPYCGEKVTVPGEAGASDAVTEKKAEADNSTLFERNEMGGENTYWNNPYIDNPKGDSAPFAANAENSVSESNTEKFRQSEEENNASLNDIGDRPSYVESERFKNSGNENPYGAQNNGVNNPYGGGNGYGNIGNPYGTPYGNQYGNPYSGQPMNGNYTQNNGSPYGNYSNNAANPTGIQSGNNGNPYGNPYGGNNGYAGNQQNYGGYNGSPYGQNPYQYGGYPQPKPQRSLNLGALIFSIINIVVFGCCCTGLIFGIPGIIFTVMAKNAANDEDEARYVKIAKILNIVGVVLGVISFVASVVVGMQTDVGDTGDIQYMLDLFRR